MKTIWKFQLETTDVQTLSIPNDHEILCIQTQMNLPCLWAVVDTDSPKEAIIIDTFGTGQPMSNGADRTYLDTYQLDGGELVFHCFKRH